MASANRTSTRRLGLVAIGLVGLVAGLGWLAGGRTDAGRALPEPAVAPGPASPTVRLETTPAPVVQASSGVERIAVEEEHTSEPATRPDASDALRGINGRVVAMNGRGVGSVRVVAENAVRDGRPAWVATDGAGRFTLDVPGPYDRLEVEDEGWVTVRYAEVRQTSRSVEHPIVVAPAIVVAGEVVDERGEPVSGARVELAIPRSAFFGLPVALDVTRQRSWATRSDPRGRFAFDPLPAVPAAVLTVRHPGHARWSGEAPQRDDGALRIVVADAPARSGRRADMTLLSGWVRHVDGRPAAGAMVHLGSRNARVNEAGEFRLFYDAVDPNDDLAAILPGFQPAWKEDFGAELAALTEEPEPIVLVLPGEGLSITGRVLDDQGRACAGWQLKLLDGIELFPGSTPPIFGEDLAAGGELAPPADPRDRIRRPRSKSPNHQQTDEAGGFAVRGLLEGREYVLRAWNETTLQIVESEPIPAGSQGVAVRVPTDVFRERVWGTVRGLDGTPLADVKARLTMRVHASHGSTSYHTGQTLHTAGDGAFSFEGVPRVDLLLRFTGESVESLYLEFPADDEGRDLDVRLARRCHLSYEGLAGPEAPDELVVLDRYGEPLRLTRHEAGSSMSTKRLGLEGGRSGTIAVSESAAWLILSRSGSEVERRPLRLDPARVFVAR